MNASVCKYALAALRSLSRFRKRMQANEISAILAIMRYHLRNDSGAVAVNTEAIRLVSMITMDEAGRTAVARCGGILAIVAAMNIFKEETKLQLFACSSLYYLSFEIRRRERITASGGAKATINAMKLHFDNAELNMHGCRTLRNLASTKSSHCIRERIKEYGGVSVIWAATENHANDPTVHFWASKALAKLLR